MHRSCQSTVVTFRPKKFKWIKSSSEDKISSEINIATLLSSRNTYRVSRGSCLGFETGFMTIRWFTSSFCRHLSMSVYSSLRVYHCRKGRNLEPSYRHETCLTDNAKNRFIGHCTASNTWDFECNATAFNATRKAIN